MVVFVQNVKNQVEACQKNKNKQSMRLRNYITEEWQMQKKSSKELSIEQMNLELFIKDIKGKCKPYLNLLGGREPLTRGMRIVSPTDFGIKAVRKDRKSLIGMSSTEVKKINQYLEYIGAARRDRSVIASSTVSNSKAMMFGDLYWIFPIGRFDYTFVFSSDFNWSGPGHSMDDFRKYIKYEYWKDPDVPEVYKPENSFMTNAGFDNAYDKEFEIWFECDKYYYMALNIPLAARFAHQMKFIAKSV